MKLRYLLLTKVMNEFRRRSVINLSKKEAVRTSILYRPDTNEKNAPSQYACSNSSRALSTPIRVQRWPISTRPPLPPQIARCNHFLLFEDMSEDLQEVVPSSRGAGIVSRLLGGQAKSTYKRSTRISILLVNQKSVYAGKKKKNYALVVQL